MEIYPGKVKQEGNTLLDTDYWCAECDKNYYKIEEVDNEMLNNILKHGVGAFTMARVDT